MASINEERVARIAAALFEARRGNRKLASLAHDLAPGSLLEAFAVQRAMTGLLGTPIAGWKVGYVPGVRLTHAPIYRDVCFESPAQVRLSSDSEPAVEAEVAFRLRRDLPRRARDYSVAEVLDAVDFACAAIEIGVQRLDDFMAAPMEHKIADNMGNGAMIWGTGTRAWRDLDMAQLPVKVLIDGRIETELVGGNACGDPFDALVALANAPTKEEPLEAGQIIITGTCTGWYIGRPGLDVSVAFEGLGEARVALQ